MELRYSLSPSSDWAIESCEQDFCKGAKASKSPECGFSTPPSSIFSEHDDEWAGLQDSLEAFCDVILPQNQQFGPEDLFEDLNKNDVAVLPSLESFEVVSPSRIKLNESDSRKPPLSIKLKKVKCTTSPFPPATFGYPNLSIVNFDSPNVFPKDCLTSDADDLTNESFGSDELEHKNHVGSVTSPCITLKDAFELENSDLILDSYLSSDGAESPTPVNESLSSVVSESGRVPSPAFSDHSSSVSVCSPWYSEDHQWTLPSSEYQQESPSGKTKGKKSRKSNYKLTAESRYLRKKEQNKQAALRYRAKKKQEDEQLSKILKEEEDLQKKLKEKLCSVQQEARILKKLLREMFIAKNVVSPSEFE